MKEKKVKDKKPSIDLLDFALTWRWIEKLKIPPFHPIFIQMFLSMIIFPVLVGIWVAIIIAVLFFICLLWVTAILFFIPSLGHSSRLISWWNRVWSEV